VRRPGRSGADDDFRAIDGMVITRAVDIGQTVASSFNTPTLFNIANDLSKMQNRRDGFRADVGGVEEGQSVTFTVELPAAEVSRPGEAGALAPRPIRTWSTTRPSSRSTTPT